MELLLKNDLIQLTAPPGCAWGFTTRQGGCGTAPYDSFNLADHVNDHPETVLRNRQLLLDKILPGKNLRWFSIQQIHGTEIIQCPTQTANPRGDIIVCREPGYCLAVLVADCVPLIFIDATNKVYGVAHCGWRGVAARGAEKALQAMLAAGARPESLQVAIGPAIGGCCFTTGAEVTAAILAGNPDAPASIFKPNIDLKALCFRQLTASGLPEKQIIIINYCTKCHPELFFSYRHSNITGRLAGYVAMTDS